MIFRSSSAVREQFAAIPSAETGTVVSENPTFHLQSTGTTVLSVDDWFPTSDRSISNRHQRNEVSLSRSAPSSISWLFPFLPLLALVRSATPFLPPRIESL